MAEKMTLIDVRDWHRFSQQAAEADGHNIADAHKELADAIDAHLAQPAQAVDVTAIRNVVRQMKDEVVDVPSREPLLSYYIEEITRAIGNAQAEGWRPIETAPSMDRCVVYQKGYGNETFMASRMPFIGHVYDCAWYSDGGGICQPTHWMPLLTPPKAEE